MHSRGLSAAMWSEAHGSQGSPRISVMTGRVAVLETLRRSSLVDSRLTTSRIGIATRAEYAAQFQGGFR